MFPCVMANPLCLGFRFDCQTKSAGWNKPAVVASGLVWRAGLPALDCVAVPFFKQKMGPFRDPTRASPLVTISLLAGQRMCRMIGLLLAGSVCSRSLATALASTAPPWLPQVLRM